jgi:hypothetical protein
MWLLRGVLRVIVTTIIWIVAWAVGSAAFVTVRFVLALRPIDTGAVVEMTIAMGLNSIIPAFVFALLVAIAERRRAFADIAGPRIAIWGAIAGAGYPMLLWLDFLRRGAALDELVEVAIRVGVLASATAVVMLTGMRWWRGRVGRWQPVETVRPAGEVREVPRDPGGYSPLMASGGPGCGATDRPRGNHKT